MIGECLASLAESIETSQGIFTGQSDCNSVMVYGCKMDVTLLSTIYWWEEQIHIHCINVPILKMKLDSLFLA